MLFNLVVFISLLGLIVIPVIAYMTGKMYTYGSLMARRQFAEKYKDSASTEA